MDADLRCSSPACWASCFLLLELHEFHGLVARGAGPTRSAFLSAFFTLVGCHGLHVTAGLLWLGTMMAQFYAKGFRRDIQSPLSCASASSGTPSTSSGSAIFSLVYLVGIESMSVDSELIFAPHDDESRPAARRAAPSMRDGVRGYLFGLALAIALTIASFWRATTHMIYGPGVPVLLVALAVAQMGIHLVFFLHITTAPDNTNNVLALAFGV